MGYLPIFLDLTGRRCVVIGGGEIAARKAESLIEAGAVVTIVSPTATAAISRLSAAGQVAHTPRKYRHGDLAKAALVFAATDDRDLDRAVADEARERGIPVNVADIPELCTFIAPAVARRGALQIAISTSGAAPAFAARIRDEIEGSFGSEYAITIEILRAARAWLRPQIAAQPERARIMKALANADLPAQVRHGDFAAIDRILVDLLGGGASLAAFGIELPLGGRSGAAASR